MAKKKGYSILLDSWGVARFPRRVKKAQIDELKKLTALLTSINGSDDRREVKNAPAKAQEMARSVALLCDDPYLVRQTNGLWELQTELSGLISNQAFSEQRKVPDGLTGFLAGEDLLLTTVHEVNVDRLRVVFDFMLDSNNEPKTTYSADEVFKVEEVARAPQNSRADWLLLRLDHSPNRPFLNIESQAAPLGAPLWMLGHPLGLPMKFVDNATVTKAGNVVFECDLDASQGNSGSPVVAPTGNALGVLQSTALGVNLEAGIWRPCPLTGHCPTSVTSSPTFAAVVSDHQGL